MKLTAADSPWKHGGITGIVPGTPSADSVMVEIEERR
jgi:hypothetical protein